MKEYLELVNLFKDHLADDNIKVYLFRPSENSEPKQSVVLRPNLTLDVNQNNKCKVAKGTLDVILTAQSDIDLINLADKLLFLRKMNYNNILMLECINPLTIQDRVIIEGKITFRLEIQKKNN